MPAARDIDGILETSETVFGPVIADRYEALIAHGIDALSLNPQRVGVRKSVDASPEIRWLHLRSVRTLAAVPERIGKPRHILVFMSDASTLTILRVLHDAMDLSAHLS